jgi:ribosomal RNA-processing protein 36
VVETKKLASIPFNYMVYTAVTKDWTFDSD